MQIRRLLGSPDAAIDHELLDARLRECPAEVCIDGVLIPLGSVASPAPPKDPPRAPAPVVLERIGNETLLLTDSALFRGATVQQIREIDVGATVIVDGGACRRSFIAGLEAIRLQHEFDWDPPVTLAAPP